MRKEQNNLTTNLHWMKCSPPAISSLIKSLQNGIKCIIGKGRHKSHIIGVFDTEAVIHQHNATFHPVSRSSA